MLTICILILFSVIFFFAGRVYEFFHTNYKMYNVNSLNYQKRLLRDCREENRENGITLNGFFINNDYRRIVIYGIGGIFYHEFIEDINLDWFDNVYLSDGNYAELQEQFEESLYAKEELLDLEYDVIVITSVSHFLEIRRELRELGITKEIVSYSDLIFNAVKEA